MMATDFSLSYRYLSVRVWWEEGWDFTAEGRKRRALLLFRFGALKSTFNEIQTAEVAVFPQSHIMRGKFKKPCERLLRQTAVCQ